MRVSGASRKDKYRQNGKDRQNRKTGAGPEGKNRPQAPHRPGGAKADRRHQGQAERGPRPLPVAADVPPRVARVGSL